MDLLAPIGLVYQAGTLSGNPIAMTAGIEVLKIIRGKDFYSRLKGTSIYYKFFFECALVCIHRGEKPSF